MILLFVRHGETNSTILGMGEVVGNDDPLNQNGVNQAANAGNTCRSFSVKQIYSSPLVRAQQTADIIGQKLQVDVIIKEDLIEFRPGDWANLKSEETKRLMEKNDVWNYSPHKYTWRVPGGESWQDVAERVRKLINQVSDYKNDEAVVCVTHNAVIRAAVGLLKDKSFKDWFGGGAHFDNGGVSGFSYDNNNSSTLFINRL